MAEALVNKAKLAEQAERYDDMAKVRVKRRINILSTMYTVDVEAFSYNS